MQFFVLALASLAIATPLVHERSANHALVARQQNAYAGYYPNSYGSGNSGDGNGNSGSGNGNSGNGSGNGNGNSGKGDNGNGNNSGNGSGNGSNNGGGNVIAPGRPGTTNPTTPTIPVGSVNPCNGLADTPQCCATNVLDLASLDCNDVPDTITSRDNFVGQCADQGLTAQCCLLPVLGQGLLCGGSLN